MLEKLCQVAEMHAPEPTQPDGRQIARCYPAAHRLGALEAADLGYLRQRQQFGLAAIGRAHGCISWISFRAAGGGVISTRRSSWRQGQALEGQALLTEAPECP